MRRNRLETKPGVGGACALTLGTETLNPKSAIGGTFWRSVTRVLPSHAERRKPVLSADEPRS